MRKRIGNPHNEAHGKAMRCYDFFLPPGADPHATVLAIEADMPGLKLHHRGDGEVHGYVNTSRRPDGSLYVCVHLYDDACDCDLHPGVAFKKSPPLSPAAEAVLARREDPGRRLTGGPQDKDVLRAHGFTDHDGPLKDA